MGQNISAWQVTESETLFADSKGFACSASVLVAFLCKLLIVVMLTTTINGNFCTLSLSGVNLNDNHSFAKLNNGPIGCGPSNFPRRWL